MHQVGNRTFIVADVEPLDLDGVRTMQVGTGLWLVALLALLPFRDALAERDATWVIWTCLAGVGLGLVGWDHCRRLRRARKRAERPEVREQEADR